MPGLCPRRVRQRAWGRGGSWSTQGPSKAARQVATPLQALSVGCRVPDSRGYKPMTEGEVPARSTLTVADPTALGQFVLRRHVPQGARAP